MVLLSLKLVLEHIEEPYFPRTISTKKSGNTQIRAHSLDDVIYYFEESEWLDCRISLFGEEEIEQVKPNAIFIDLDDKNSLEFVKTRIHEMIGGVPLVIFTGNGYAIIQPIQMKSMKELEFPNLSNYEIATKFLKYAKTYLTNNRADPCNNPSLKSCMVRVPYTINSKNNCTVEFMESWDNHRVSVKNIPFKKYMEQFSKNEDTNNHARLVDSQKFQWIEKLLETKIDDYRNFLLFDVCRYLINIKKLSIEQSTNIIHKWIGSSKYPRTRIRSEVKRANRDGKFPRKLQTIYDSNPEASKKLASLGIMN